MRFRVGVSMKTWRIRRLTKERILAEETARIRIVEPRLSINEPGLFIFLVPGKRKLVRADANAILLVAPGIVENALPCFPRLAG